MITLRPRLCRLALILAAAIFSSANASAQVTVEIFRGYVDNGNSISFFDPVGSFNSPNIDFFIGTGGVWQPYGLTSFGARFTGNRYGPSEPRFTSDMGIMSSDGSYLFFNGELLINNGGIHGPRGVQALYFALLPGANPFELQFFKSPGGGLRGVEMTTYSASGGAITMPPSAFVPRVPDPMLDPVLAPEPSTLPLVSIGGIGLLLWCGRKRRHERIQSGT